MKTPLIRLFGGTLTAMFVAFSSAAFAGTVNIDFEPVAGTTGSTRALLGTGTVWNGVTGPVAGGPGAGLLDDQGTVTQVGVSAPNPGTTFGLAPYTGANVVQEDGLVNGGGAVTFTIGFLRGGEPYRIVFVNGALGLNQNVTANGVAAVCNGRTDPPPALPGVAGMDHVVLDNVIADPVGDITISAVGISLASGACAGIQIQGWFEGEDPKAARQADVSVSRRRGGGYKGNNRYANRPTGAQRITSRGSRGRFFFRLENDGNAFAEFMARASRSGRDAKRRYTALRPNRNVTAQIGRGKYMTVLDPGETKVIKTVVRSRGSRSNINTDLRCFPDGRGGQDAASGRLRP